MPSTRSNRPNVSVYNGTGSSGSDILKRRESDADQWYYDLIKQYEGSSFYDVLLANPFLRSKNAPFSPNFGQQLGEVFGDTSGEDRYYADLKSKANQWFAETIEKMRQQDYDSAPSQVARERSAGLNPDLNGNISPGSAAENDQPFGSVQMSDSNPLAEIANFGKECLNICSLAVGFAENLGSLKGVLLDNDKKQLDFTGDMSNLVSRYLKEHTGVPTKDDDGHWIFPELNLESLDSFTKEMGFSRSVSRSFKRRVQDTYSSVQGIKDRFDGIKDAEEAWRRAIGSLGDNLGYGRGTDDFYNNDAAIIIAEELGSLRKHSEKLNLEENILEEGYNKEFYDNIDPSLAAGAENSNNQTTVLENDAKKGQIEVQKLINDTISRIIKRLGDNKDPFSQSLILLFSVLQSNMIPSVPGKLFSSIKK